MENQQLRTTDYFGTFQYLDGSLDFVHRPEGYVKAVHTGEATEFHYVYNYTDHLGNIRLSYGRDPERNEVAILNETHYYPFGLSHNGYVSTHKILGFGMASGKVELIPVRNYLDDSYRYTFGGKEEQPELGLNWMDFHARNYDAALGRWMNVDPLGEEMPSHSPYNYAFNNPVYFIDPDGMMARSPLEHQNQRDFSLENNIWDFDSRAEKDDSDINFNDARSIMIASNDCNGCPSTYRHKNREVITNQENDKDYMLYDNQWHQLPEQKIFEKFYPDSEHPKGGMTLTRTREELFIEGYDAKTINNSFFIGAVGIGTITGFIEGIKNPLKKSPFFAILAGAEEAIKNVKGLYDRMDDHDKEVERNF